MTRDEMVALVVKEASQIVPGLDPEGIDLSLSLRNQGASSLDLVELVSVLMRQLRIKVSRSDLAKVATLDGLVDLLMRAEARRSATPIS